MPDIVPVKPLGTAEIVWDRWEQPVVAVGGVVPVAAIMLVFPAGTCRHCTGFATVVHHVSGVLIGVYPYIIPGVFYHCSKHNAHKHGTDRA